MAYYDRGRGVPARGVRADLLGSASETRHHRPSVRESAPSHLHMQPFVQQYIETALWSSTDDQGNDLTHYELAPQTVDFLKRDAMQFERENRTLLDRAYSLGHRYTPFKAGHDFWLTRNRHGAGFWDRDDLGRIGKQLTDAAHQWPEVDLYVGDDGLVYASGHERWANEARRPARMKLGIAGEAEGFRPGFQGGPVKMVTGQLGAGATRVKEGHLRGIRYEVYEDPNSPPRQRYRSGGKFAAVVWTPYDSPNHGRGVEGEIVGRSDTIDGAAEIAKNYIDSLAKYGEFWHGSEDGPTEDKEAIADHLRAEGHGPEYIRMAIGDEAYAKWSRARGYGAGEASRRRPPRHMSAKFERCVQHVKAKGRAVNPWAICHASLGQKAYAGEAGEAASRPIDLSEIYGSHNEGNLSRAFRWLTRTGMGPAFGSRPIGWYQMHQVAALDIIEEKATSLGTSLSVRVHQGQVQALSQDGEEWISLGLSTRQVYEMADRRSRGEGAHECVAGEDCNGHGGANEERPEQPGYYAVYPNGRIASGPYGSRDEADGEAKRIGGFVQFEAGERGARELKSENYNVYRDGVVVGHVHGTWLGDAHDKAKAQFGEGVVVFHGDPMPVGMRRGQRLVGVNDQHIVFPKGWVKDYVTMGLEDAGVRPTAIQYGHLSTDVAFTTVQLDRFLKFMRRVSSDRDLPEEDKQRAQDVIDLVLRVVSVGASEASEAGEAIGFHEIKPGDRVTIVNRFGQNRSGKAIMRGPAGWVLNMGGPHGTPDIATPENFVSASRRAGGHRKDREAGEDRLSYADKQNLPARSFALPKKRALPLIDAAHVRNAAVRLSMMKHLGHVTPAEYRKAKAKIDAAGKKYGIKHKEMKEAYEAKHEAKEDFTVSARSPDEIAQADAARHIILKSPQDIYEFVAPSVRGMTQETFLVVPMDLHGSPLVTKPILIAMGQRDRVQVDPGDVVRPVIEKNAAAFVVCHQHPSGRPLPSDADKELTDSIREAARVACPSTVFLDHCIVGANEVYSFTDGKVHRIH